MTIIEVWHYNCKPLIWTVVWDMACSKTYTIPTVKQRGRWKIVHIGMFKMILKVSMMLTTLAYHSPKVIFIIVKSYIFERLCVRRHVSMTLGRYYMKLMCLNGFLMETSLCSQSF